MHEITNILYGVIPKKGAGTTETGVKWSHDHIELHVLFPILPKIGIGKAATVLKIEDHDKWHEAIKSLVGHECIFTMETFSTKKGAVDQCVNIRLASKK